MNLPSTIRVAYAFNISSFMGLIMVIGIVAKNGILLLDAMIQAGECRLRPILMTALATVAGMIPLASHWEPARRCSSRSPSQ